MAEVIKAVTIRFKYTRLKGLVSLLIILTIACLIMLYKYGYFGVAYQKVFGAEVTITITDSENKGLPANVQITNIKKTKYNSIQKADENGQVAFEKLVSGQYQINIGYAGYTSLSENIKIKRGKNTTSYKLEKIPAKKININGVIQNYINEQPISGAKITVEGQSVTTDASGKYSMENITTQEQDVVIEKSGYITNSRKIVITVSDVGKLTLTPEGRVVYVSNKDQGKRGLFTVNYDGTDPKPLVERKGEYEDYGPILSPDKKKVVFSSTREGARDGNVPRVDQFIVDITGKNLNKVCEQCYQAVWSSNSKNIVWQNSHKNEASQIVYEAYIYKVASNENLLITSQINSTINGLVFNESATKIAYSINGSIPPKYEIYIYDINSAVSSKIVDGQAYIYVMKFISENEVLYNSYHTPSGHTKYYAFKLADNTSSEVDYQYPNRYANKSPDGKKVAYGENRDGKGNVYVADNDKGTNEKQLTNVDAHIISLYWSGDGKYIVFEITKPGESALYAVGIEGGVAKKIIDTASNDRM